jgi:hypothetical protein
MIHEIKVAASRELRARSPFRRPRPRSRRRTRLFFEDEHEDDDEDGFKEKPALQVCQSYQKICVRRSI